MADDHWDPALEDLNEKGTGLFGPKSFMDYLEEIGEDRRDYRTPAEISIDTYIDLSPKLRDHDTMVLRLGFAPEGRGTGFALVKVDNALDDFFIQEREIPITDEYILDFSREGEDIDLLNRQTRDMLEAYRQLPRFSESSYVNLALSTGIFSQALDFDCDIIGTAPTTISSSYSFDFQPHSRLEHVLHHDRGQVEIDAIIITRKQGKRVAVVIEAKSGSPRALAKHKLFYPYLAVKNLIPDDIHALIPVYVRAQTFDDSITYDIYEGSVNSQNDNQPSMDELTITNCYRYSLHIV